MRATQCMQNFAIPYIPTWWQGSGFVICIHPYGTVTFLLYIFTSDSYLKANQYLNIFFIMENNLFGNSLMTSKAFLLCWLTGLLIKIEEL